MLIPEKDKQVRSIKVPKIIFKTGLFLSCLSIITFAVLSYDYIKILEQVYRNKHLTIENLQLREQIQLFQMKINSIIDDIERISTFEKKLRIITGINKTDLSKGLKENTTNEKSNKINLKSKSNTFFKKIKDTPTIKKNKKYQTFKELYEQKIASELGQGTAYKYVRDWSSLLNQTMNLAEKYALFDYKFNETRSFIKNLEVNIHQIDQFLLDKKSFLRSTPTLMPTDGWITSYYGPRKSHYTHRIKMHEGLDIGARKGRKIISTADGIVTFAGTKPGFGNFVKVQHGYGIETIYAHAKSILVKKGQQIKRGHPIALVGSTGYSTGPHVHYEVRVNDVPVDPLYFILH